MGPGDALPSDWGFEVELEMASPKSRPIASMFEASAPVPESEDAFSHSFEMSFIVIASELSIFD